jgi:hypothetical protein
MQNITIDGQDVHASALVCLQPNGSYQIEPTQSALIPPSDWKPDFNRFAWRLHWIGDDKFVLRQARIYGECIRHLFTWRGAPGIGGKAAPRHRRLAVLGDCDEVNDRLTKLTAARASLQHGERLQRLARRARERRPYLTPISRVLVVPVPVLATLLIAGMAIVIAVSVATTVIAVSIVAIVIAVSIATAVIAAIIAHDTSRHDEARQGQQENPVHCGSSKNQLLLLVTTWSGHPSFRRQGDNFR